MDNKLDMEAEANKKIMQSIMDRMDKMAMQSGVGHPDGRFASVKKALAKTTFNVVVCGEVKQGKSTLINSLVGQDILPTDVDVATSQVCVLTNSNADKNAACALVFDEGDRVGIPQSAIERYGKETGLNLHRDSIIAGRSLSYIEVQVPIRFLPDGVRLIDTPGLDAAVNPQHAVIAHEWISRADAVIFVTDVSRPLVKNEIRELQRIYAATPNVLMVQTKVDKVGTAKATAIAEDNKKKLAEALAAKGIKSEVVICPFSAKLLADCAKTGDSEIATVLREESKVDDVLKALKHLFLQTVCYYVLTSAYEQALMCYKMLMVEIEKRKKELTANAEERKRLREEAERRISEFNTMWGREGKKVKEVSAFVATLGKTVVERMQVLIGSGAQSLDYIEFCKSIDTLDNSEQIEDYQDNLHSWVRAAVRKHMSDINGAIAKKYDEQLSAYVKDIVFGGNDVPQLAEDTSRIDVPELSVLQKARNFMIGVMTGTFVAKIIDVVAIILIPVTGGASIALAAVAEATVIGVGAYRGVKMSSNTALSNQRAALKRVALEDLIKCWNELRQAEFGEKSKLVSWIEQSENQFRQSLQKVIDDFRVRLEADLARLKEEDQNLGKRQKELEKILVLEGKKNPDGSLTGLLSLKEEMVGVCEFIKQKAAMEG